jgi:Bacterial Ig-like domain (group 3)
MSKSKNKNHVMLIAGLLLLIPAPRALAQAPTTSNVTCVASSVAFGASTTCTATVKGSNPTGTVTFSSSRNDGAFIPGDACTLSGGACSVSYTMSASGCLIACEDTTVSITGSYGGDGSNQPSQSPPGSAQVKFHSCWFQECLINHEPLSTQYDDYLCIIGNSPSDQVKDCKLLVVDFSAAPWLTDDVLNTHTGINLPGAGAWAALASGLTPPTGCAQVAAAIGYATTAGEFDFFGDTNGELNIWDSAQLSTIDCAVDINAYNAGTGFKVPDITFLQAIEPLVSINAAVQQAVAEVAVSLAIACGGDSYICNASDIIKTLLSNEHNTQAKAIPVAGLAKGTWGSHSGSAGIGWSLASCNADTETPDPDNLVPGFCGGSLCKTNPSWCANPPVEGTATDAAIHNPATLPSNKAASVQCATGFVQGLGIGFDGDVSFDVNDVPAPPTLSAALTDTTPSTIRPLLNPHNFAAGSGGTAPPNGIDVEIPLADRGTYHDRITALRTGSKIKVCGYWVTDMHDLWNELHPITFLALFPTLTYSGDASGTFNHPASLAADLADPVKKAGIDGATITFTLGSQSCSGVTDASGHASCSITIQQDPPGPGTVTATYGGDTPVSASAPFTISKAGTKLTYTGPLTQDYHDAFTASATLTDPVGGALIANMPVTFSLGSGDSCGPVMTNGSGVASCPITPTQKAGTLTITASFAGNADYQASTDAESFAVTREETTLTYIGPTVILQGASGVTLKAKLLEDGTTAPTPVGRTITLGLGTQTCTGATDASGIASCSLTFTGALGPEPLSATFAGDAYYLPSSDASRTATVFAFPSQGAFVLGDIPVGLAGPATTLTWWSDTWSAQNSLSGGAAPATFKGYAGTVTSLPSTTPAAVCGGTWTSSGGNSPAPPSGVPSYMGVLVTKTVTKAGNSVTGDFAEIVVVKVNPGYGPQPDTPGTGTIVAVSCR